MDKLEKLAEINGQIAQLKAEILMAEAKKEALKEARFLLKQKITIDNSPAPTVSPFSPLGEDN